MLSKKISLKEHDEDRYLEPAYASRSLAGPVPRYELPSGSMPPEAAYRIIHDELALDGNPELNLATFVTTWMEPEADRLMLETLGKNAVDQDEYPQTLEIQHRCVNIISRLFNAPEEEEGIGCATVGSSEAIHLAGLAMKWRWRAKREAAGKDSDRPNLVMGRNVQVCWEKFARYFEVEARYVPLTEDRHVIGVEEALALVDERTIGVVGILGSTYTGEYEPIEEMNRALCELDERTGWDVPLHVDAASGGFVAPFLQPHLRWDFRLEKVRSINVSGHKYGLVYPGVGWVVWRQAGDLPDELVFHVSYLGGDEPTFNLNFSRGAGQIVAQYYNFLRLGQEGYRDLMRGLHGTARWLAGALEKLGPFELLSRGDDLPLVCARLAKEVPYSVYHLSDLLRRRGWIVPAYPLAPDAQDISVLRIVVREGLSRDMAGSLVEEIERAITELEATRPSGVGTSPLARQPGKAIQPGHPHRQHGTC